MGLVSVNEESDRHDLDPVRLHRPHRLAILTLRLLAGKSNHLWLAWAVNIGIEQANRSTVSSKRQCQVDRDRRFTNTALAGGHGDDIAHARHRLQVALHPMGNNARFEAQQ